MNIDNRIQKRDRRRRAAVALALATFCAGVCLSCSDDPTVDVTVQCLDFIGAEGSPSGNIVARKSSSSSCNFLVLDLVATDIADIFSAEVTVEYATSVAGIFMFEVGPLLTGADVGTFVGCASSESDYAVSCQATGDFEQGTVDISLSRTNPVWNSETAVAGTEGSILARLTFSQLSILAGANGPFGYRYGKLLNAAMPPQNIIDINGPAITNGTFLGGQLVIVEQ